MKNFTKYKVAFVAFVAQSIQNPLLVSVWRLLKFGTLLAQLAFSKIVCATCAKFVPLKNSLKPLLLLDCATCATYATCQIIILENG
jgi:hypothetical protein